MQDIDASHEEDNQHTLLYKVIFSLTRRRRRRVALTLGSVDVATANVCRLAFILIGLSMTPAMVAVFHRFPHQIFGHISCYQ